MSRGEAHDCMLIDILSLQALHSSAVGVVEVEEGATEAEGEEGEEVHGVSQSS